MAETRQRENVIQFQFNHVVIRPNITRLTKETNFVSLVSKVLVRVIGKILINVLMKNVEKIKKNVTIIKTYRP